MDTSSLSHPYSKSLSEHLLFRSFISKEAIVTDELDNHKFKQISDLRKCYFFIYWNQSKSLNLHLLQTAKTDEDWIVSWCQLPVQGSKRVKAFVIHGSPRHLDSIIQYNWEKFYKNPLTVNYFGIYPKRFLCTYINIQQSTYNFWRELETFWIKLILEWKKCAVKQEISDILEVCYKQKVKYVVEIVEVRKRGWHL